MSRRKKSSPLKKFLIYTTCFVAFGAGNISGYAVNKITNFGEKVSPDYFGEASIELPAQPSQEVEPPVEHSEKTKPKIQHQSAKDDFIGYVISQNPPRNDRPHVVGLSAAEAKAQYEKTHDDREFGEKIVDAFAGLF